MGSLLTGSLLTGSLLMGVLSVEVSAAEVSGKVTYEEHIKPIFRQHCLNCHHQGDKKGGLALDTYGSMIEGGGSGEVVFDDGDAEGSRLWQLVNHDDTPVMPPNQSKIEADKLTLIRAWIEGGILENDGSPIKKKKANPLAFVASTGGKPSGPAAMPMTVPLQTPVVTERAAAITAVAASPWAPLIAVAGQKQVVLYHSDTHELLGILPFPEGVAQDLKFSRDGAFLIIGGGEHSVQGMVAVVDVKTGERVASIGDELDTVFGSDANDDMSRIALGGPQKMLRIFDSTSGEMLFDLKKHTDWIYSVAFSPDGVLIASGDRSGGLCVWEADTGRLYLDLTGHKGGIHSLAWRDDSNVLASASADGTVKLWEMNNGKAIRTINAHGGGVMSVAFDHQGRIATAGNDKRAKLWDAAGKELKSLQNGAEAMLEVAISHDGKRLVYGNWSGQVFNTPIDQPKSVAELAANPEPASKRVEQVKLTLVSVQKKLSPARSEWDKAMASVAAANKPLQQLDQKITAARKAATDNQAAADRSAESAKGLAGELPSLTTLSRDIQDELTAMRVALKADSGKAVEVALAEEKLAAKLLEIAKKRRERIAALKLVASHQKIAAEKSAEADQLAKTRPGLLKSLEAAQAVAASTKSAHDAVAAELAKVQSKVARLAAEMK